MFKNLLEKISHHQESIDSRRDKGEHINIDDDILEEMFSEMKFSGGQNAGRQRREKEILRLQVEKQKIMDRLHYNLKSIDNAEKYPRVHEENAIDIRYDDDSSSFFAGKESVSLGQLLSDGDWGIQYDLDESVPRKVKKKYYVEEAKRRLRQFYDKQISQDNESICSKPEDLRRLDEGIIVEMVVANLFSRLVFDAKPGFSLVPGNAYEDGFLKADFILRTDKQIQRGVHSNSSDGNVIGIQLYAGSSAKKIEKKDQQIQRLLESGKLPFDDLVLVNIPLKGIKQIVVDYLTTMEDGKISPGGPTIFMQISDKERIIRGVLDKFVSDQEIDNIVGVMREHFERDKKIALRSTQGSVVQNT